MPSAVGRFKIIAKDVVQRMYTVQLWDSHGWEMPLVYWRFEDLVFGEEYWMGQRLTAELPPWNPQADTAQVELGSASATSSKESNVDQVATGSDLRAEQPDLDWSEFYWLLAEMGITSAPRAWAWFRLLEVEGVVSVKSLQGRLPLPGYRMTLNGGRAVMQWDDPSEDTGADMDWEDFATFMMELGGRDFRAIEAHWDGMQRNGRVRSADGSSLHAGRWIPRVGGAGGAHRAACRIRSVG